MDPSGEFFVVAIPWIIEGAGEAYAAYRAYRAARAAAAAYRAYQAAKAASDAYDENGAGVCYAKKQSKKSGKEKANDIPSWVRNTGKRPGNNQKCQDFAKQLLDEKYGPGNWSKGSDSEFNKIVKWCQRSLK